MIPIFKTNFSIGKSLFTLSESSEEGGPPSLIELIKKEKLKEVVLIEETMTGFPEAFKKINSKTTKLIFGLVFMFGTEEHKSKIIAIAKNDDGIRELNKIHTEQAFSGFISEEFLSNEDPYPINSGITLENIQICVPFYDSFLFNNIMEYQQITLDLKKYNPIFFLEDNDLPFDSIVSSRVKKYCKDFGFEYVDVKSILYENREDAEALQTYKIITNRKNYKNPSLSKPELEHFGSREFCWESFKEANNA